MTPIKITAIIAVALIIIPLVPGSGKAISIPDEKKLAKKFMTMIEERNILLKDPVANHMINTVGKTILSNLPPQPFDYSFYLINDNTFNAFASPGAHIFIHRGLITALSNIDELAGIMAHEIAHVVSRHVSQSIERSKLVNIGSLAGMLAGVIAGSAGSSEAAQALTIGSVAAGQSAMLAYTRENETEADQKGVLFLKASCYDPKGLLDSLLKIRDADYQGIEGIPDYFKTHPGTSTRVAHIASLLSGCVRPDPLPECPKTYDYSMVKYRLIGLYDEPDKSMAKIAIDLEKDPDNPALNYGMGLLQSRKYRRQKAEEYFEKALSQRLFDPLILLELGRVYIADGKFSQALEVLAFIQDEPVMGIQARYQYAVAQLESGDLPGAQKNLSKVIETLPDTFPKAYYYMAQIMSRHNETALSDYYLGVYYTQIKDEKNASLLLRKALEDLKDPELRKDAQKRLEKKSKRKEDS